MDSLHQSGPYRSQSQGPPGPSYAGAPHLGAIRPLSDIRELTEPNLIEVIQRKQVGDSKHILRPSASGSLRSQEYRLQPPSRIRPPSRGGRRSPSAHFDGHDDRASVYSIPLDNVPIRSSSRPGHKRSHSIPRTPAVVFPASANTYKCIPNRGQSQSPVRNAANRLDPGESHRNRRMPSKTIVKVENANSKDILNHPMHPHPRIRIEIQLAAPLFVGGGSVEGVVRIIVDEAERVRHRKTLTLERISVDLLGIEEVSGAKRNIFLSLGNELVDLAHLPPLEMVISQQSITPQECSWILVPSISTLPFLITLPLEVGPPPFQSKHARIRYILCVTATIKDSGRQLCVRSSQETAVLSVYDPEKALVSLPSPLTASDDYISSRGDGREKITMTAGLHRQVWVSGTSLFTDVHIANNSRRNIKRLELQVERIILCYRHTAAATLEMSASQSRLFDQQERLVIAKSIIKCGHQGWAGVWSQTTDLRTFDLELPRGHATIKCNKYFEVRYYLNVIASTNHHKLVTVQLPIVLIHMNSLDVPTNSVAQVAAAIEEKRGTQTDGPAYRPSRHGRQRSPSRARQHSVGLQGRAFAAPRMQSLERTRAQREDLEHLGQILDRSPRKNPSRYNSPDRKASPSYTFKTPPSNRKGRVILDDDADELRARLARMRSFGEDGFGADVLNRSPVPPQTLPARASSSAMGFYMQRAGRMPVATGDGTADTRTYIVPRSSSDFRKPKWPQDG